MKDLISKAIREKRVLTFHYSQTRSPGFRTVEPHMVADNEAGHTVLSAWFLRGSSGSQEGAGWREYLLSAMSSARLEDATFVGPRKGYSHGGGSKFQNVQCAL